MLPLSDPELPHRKSSTWHKPSPDDRLCTIWDLTTVRVDIDSRTITVSNTLRRRASHLPSAAVYRQRLPAPGIVHIIDAVASDHLAAASTGSECEPTRQSAKNPGLGTPQLARRPSGSRVIHGNARSPAWFRSNAPRPIRQVENASASSCPWSGPHEGSPTLPSPLVGLRGWWRPIHLPPELRIQRMIGMAEAVTS